MLLPIILCRKFIPVLYQSILQNKLYKSNSKEKEVDTATAF